MGQMMNMYDIDSLNSFATARRERFYDEVRQIRIAREIGIGRQRVPSRFRRAVGMGLIHAGTRLSGANSVDMRRAKSAI
jgi:DNA-binding transcriptional regulator LsrR (DeoR family)